VEETCMEARRRDQKAGKFEENCLEYWLAHFLLLSQHNTYRLLPWPHPHKG